MRNRELGQLSGSFQVQTPFSLKCRDLVGERSGEWWYILIPLLKKSFPFARVSKILPLRMSRKEIEAHEAGIKTTSKVLLISSAARRPWSSPCTSLRDSPNKFQTFAWWELSSHIQQTFPECLLCAQHWAEIQGSSGSCTPPVGRMLTCSQ